MIGAMQDVTQRREAEANLAQTQRRLLESSRQAGMAEVATGVLHNVGNVLNSINVSSTVIADAVRKSKAANLGRAVALLDEHEQDLSSFLTGDPRGKQLPKYLRQLADRMNTEQEHVLQEVGSLQKNIDHVRDIVSMQQGYAKVSGVRQLVNVAELIEDSLRLVADVMTRYGVEVVREFDPVPVVSVERHKVLQILVNLIRNAKQSCIESGRPDKRIILRVSKDGGFIRIGVVDNGVGIPEENLTRIFAHGFTTKETGHGFGLHNAALAAKEMRGTITVCSDGPGKGAVFTLELPLENQETRESAA
jgi:signal transduction histidine kinase